MKNISTLVSISLLLCSTASAFQGGGGESTKKKPAPKKPSASKPLNTTPVRSTTPPIRPAVPALGGVVVHSNQPNATVTLNGTPVGTIDGEGAFVIETLKPGVYSVSVTKPGYQPGITSVKVSAGQIEILYLDLRPREQALNILSSQPKSEIYVDDVLRGSTDAAGGLRLTDLQLGSHRITARKKGYKDASVSVSLVGEQEGRVTLSLEWAGGAPSFERPTYRVTVQSLERNTNTYTATLVFENLTNETIKIAWQQQSNLVPDATGPYLIDEDGEKYFARGIDSAKILQDTMMFLWVPITELPPKTRLTSRFLFVGKGMGTTFSLNAKELVGLEPEVPITIDGLKIGSQTEVPPQTPPVLPVGKGAAAKDNAVKNQLGMEFAFVPAGSFVMGSNSGEDDVKPAHRVTISERFLLSKYEVTQAQWTSIMGTTVSQQRDGVNEGYPLRGEGDNFPIYFVRWGEVKQFLSRLNAKYDDYTYRLPTEAEWEYAERAGTTEDRAVDFQAMGWYNMNSESMTHPVGQKKANAYGLFDMYGNVFEWCEDVWHSNYDGAPADGSAWLGGADSRSHVLRGGSWVTYASDLRSAYRDKGTADSGPYDLFGFRLVAVRRSP